MSLQQSRISYGFLRAVEHSYLCNYQPRRAGFDFLSASLLRFKDALSADLEAWVDCAVKELQQLSISDETIIIRSLHSEETLIDTSTDTALDKLGKTIANIYSAQWMPQLINKPAPIRKVKLLSKAERRKELHQAYSLSPDYFDFNDKKILLIDDIVTTGTTAISIIRLIKQYFPRSRFRVFTLAKATYDPSLNSTLKLTGNEYSWERQTGWMAAEDEAHYHSYASLRACILSDNFEQRK